MNDDKEVIRPARPSANTVYIGSRLADRTPIVTANGKELSPRPSQRLWNHSPDGFEWGYGGSGPAQLALALLLHATSGNSVTALSLYQSFKWEVVARFDYAQWAITRERILGWIAAKVCPLPEPGPAVDGGAE